MIGEISMENLMVQRNLKPISISRAGVDPEPCFLLFKRGKHSHE